MKINLRKTVTAVLLVAGGHAAVLANPLEVELRNLLDNHPGLKAARLTSAAAGDRVRAATGALYPKLTLAGDAGKEDISSTSYSNFATSEKSIPQDSLLNRRKLSLVAELNLFNGGRDSATIRLAETETAIQEANLKALTQDVLLESLVAYLQMARFQTLIGLAKLNEQTTQQQLELEAKRVDGGGGIAVDVLQARTRLQIVRERRVFYEQGLRDAMANYEQVFGRAPDVLTLQDLQYFEQQLPKTIADATTRGIEKSARLQAAVLQIEKSKSLIEMEKSGFMPKLDLVALQGKDRNAMQLANREEKSVLLRLNWQLFSGGETMARMSAAVKDSEEAFERDALARNKVREAIRISWNQVINGSERLELLDSAAGISRDVMNNRKRLRDAGKESAVIVLDAEVEYFGVLFNKVNAMYDTRIGSYRLLASMGELSPENLGLDGSFKLPVRPLSVELEKIAAPISRPL